MYVAEPERRLALYRSVQEMLVSGVILITTALTWPPGGPKTSAWVLDKVDIPGLLLTQRIYGLIELRWSIFCNTAESVSQLEAAGYGEHDADLPLHAKHRAPVDQICGAYLLQRNVELVHRVDLKR